MTQRNAPKEKSLNPFQAAIYIVTVAMGISTGEKRNYQLSRVGSGTLLLAFLILALTLYGAMRLFVYLVRQQLAT